MTSPHILMIDDDQELTELLEEYFVSEGFQFTCCHDGESGLHNAYNNDIDLILLDVMMPKLNGFEVLKALGGRHTTPILMLTAKGDDTDKVLGLELGADDYLPKPFKHKELLARINAILRRIEITEKDGILNTNTELSVNHVTLNYATRKVLCYGHVIELTGTEYQLLEMLMMQPNVIVSKSELSEKVLHRKLSAFDRSIDMHISNIRRKLLPYSPSDKLKTIRGAGYIFLSGENK
ncbi:response regulator transcription factor [Pseudocolwellia agarivorans]|uniref:response regulator transcription factor n=1 Tax=Pseudocolwellia agarivorans TaxID=1911682 RepID=UPI0009859E1C|nr:response regulator transcription factor [Pseudocolwellia agarivorans]